MKQGQGEKWGVKTPCLTPNIFSGGQLTSLTPAFPRPWRREVLRLEGPLKFCRRAKYGTVWHQIDRKLSYEYS